MAIKGRQFIDMQNRYLLPGVGRMRGKLRRFFNAVNAFDIFLSFFGFCIRHNWFWLEIFVALLSKFCCKFCGYGDSLLSGFCEVIL